jgi:hypothetical protein
VGKPAKNPEGENNRQGVPTGKNVSYVYRSLFPILARFQRIDRDRETVRDPTVNESDERSDHTLDRIQSKAR